MADVVDDADQTIALELAAQIAAIKKKTGPQLAPIGMCHNCEADIEPGKLFCAPVGSEMSECQVDYEKRVRRAVR